VKVVGVDPGRTTGLAFVTLTPTSRVLHYADGERDVEHVGRLLLKWSSDNPDIVVVVEDFLGAGPRSADSNHTLKVVGFTYYLCQMEGIPSALVPPQARLSSMDDARALAQGRGVHATDATAHALAWARRRWETP